MGSMACGVLSFSVTDCVSLLRFHMSLSYGSLDQLQVTTCLTICIDRKGAGDGRIMDWKFLAKESNLGPVAMNVK